MNALLYNLFQMIKQKGLFKRAKSESAGRSSLSNFHFYFSVLPFLILNLILY